jgi:hypothetical protein
VTRIPELEQELVAAATRLRSPRRVLRPAARVALAAAAIAVLAVLLVVEATDRDHGGRAGQKTGTPPSQGGTKVGVDASTGVRFTFQGRQLTVTVLPWALSETRTRVSGARIRATCGVAFAQVGPEGDPRNAREEHTRLWPAGQDSLRFRFRGVISSSNARWCRAEDAAVGNVGFVQFGTAPVRMRSPDKRIKQIANDWARLLAASDPAVCDRYMTQPACEQMECMRVGNRPVENCTPVSPAFRRSFRGARVENLHIDGDYAGVAFSNGRTAVLTRVEDTAQGGVWWIAKFRGNPARRLLGP